jgi:hypothetical protein
MAMTDYVRAALKEKASKDLAALEQKSTAFAAIDGVRTAIRGLVEGWPATAAGLSDPALTAKMKKLRKAIDEAQALSSEISEAIGGDARRSELAAERKAIIDALASAGIDEASINASGGDAQ